MPEIAPCQTAPIDPERSNTTPTCSTSVGVFSFVMRCSFLFLQHIHQPAERPVGRRFMPLLDPVQIRRRDTGLFGKERLRHASRHAHRSDLAADGSLPFLLFLAGFQEFPDRPGLERFTHTDNLPNRSTDVKPKTDAVRPQNYPPASRPDGRQQQRRMPQGGNKWLSHAYA